MSLKRKGLVQQLIRSARGQTAATELSSHAKRPPLPCFTLHQHHFGRINSFNNANQASQTIVPTPSDFHKHLCDRIKSAQDRVILASLYIGVGSDRTKSSDSQQKSFRKEDELLQALNYAALNPSLNKIQILLDANRALRKVSYTTSTQSHSSDGKKQSYSAQAVYSELTPFLQQERKGSNGVFLFPVNNFQLCSILPSPLGEVAGVFHIKAYIIDNELILSGANLSEEYFTNRLDRYMSFVNGGGGLVDFYADLCDVLCKYAMKYDGSWHDNILLFTDQGENSGKLELEKALMGLFNGERYRDIEKCVNDTTSPVAYAIPTFQMPESFLGRPMDLHSDAQITRNLLQSALDHESSISVRLSSAYLNLTPVLLFILTKFGRRSSNNSSDNNDPSNGTVYLLTAGTTSHGFAPKRKGNTQQNSTGIVNKIKDSIPEAFLSLVKQVAKSIINRGGKALMYERLGWTFHAKGIWITIDNAQRTNKIRQTQPELIYDTSALIGTVIGSGNYGARSENLDVESNLVIIFNDGGIEKSSPWTKGLIAEEWNEMCCHSNEFTDTKLPDQGHSKIVDVVLGFLKRFL